jgi:hypothetical protein
LAAAHDAARGVYRRPPRLEIHQVIHPRWSFP